ncbi:MAG: signal peptidase II [Parachlamydiaceae bacterium]|nr:signal peptidase II [Parachlamydiaceae bacterium]
MRKYNRWVALFIGCLVLAADLLTKYWVQSHLHPTGYSRGYPYGGIPVFHNFFGIEFSINHETNRGAAWGMLANWQAYLVFFRIALIIGLLCYFFFFNKRRTWDIPLILITAGALGNIVDYFIYGHVIDMFHFVLWGYDYPVFNVADSAIFIGIAWLFILSFIEDRKYGLKE